MNVYLSSSVGGSSGGDTTTLKRVDTGVRETAVDGVEYFSPDQQGGRYGKIIRKYYSGSTFYSDLHNVVIHADMSKYVIAGGDFASNSWGRWPFPTTNDSNVGLVDTDKFEIAISFNGTYEIYVDYVRTPEPILEP